LRVGVDFAAYGPANLPPPSVDRVEQTGDCRDDGGDTGEEIFRNIHDGLLAAKKL
jgi:hypothetical protein